VGRPVHGPRRSSRWVVAADVDNYDKPMVSGGHGKRRVRISAEVIVEITDGGVLLRDVLHALEGLKFSDAEERAAELASVAEDPVSAVERLADPYSIIDSSGVEVTEALHTVVELDDSGAPVLMWPDFADLFAQSGGSANDYRKHVATWLTPRTAAVLWTSAQLLADLAYDDVVEHGDEPVSKQGVWSLFHDYPWITWRKDAVWRRQAARAFDDLAADLESGHPPRPTCPAEEMALHLVLRDAQVAVEDGGPDSMMDGPNFMPEDPNDFRWNLPSEDLFQDHDILALFENGSDGIEEPDAEENLQIGMGDYTPNAWFATFLNMKPRDPRRPFRR
jgi:hypothetical protein